MGKFKRIFYPIYIIFTLGFLYLSIDSLLNMESQLVWFNEKFGASAQPYWIMVFFLILVLLMAAEIIAENMHIRQVKEGINDLEDEIVRLKAKLFDQMDDGDDEEEEGDEDDDENDD